MEKECKIVQDLLPNYLEKVTTEETNEFIENHIGKCKECNYYSYIYNNDWKKSNCISNFIQYIK